MSINISVPSNGETIEMKPRITVFGVGGAGGNAVNNMIQSELEGVEFVVSNTDAQALALARTDRRIQLGVTITQGLGAGSRPDIGRAAAEEVMDDIVEHLRGSHMAFITAGMGGGTGTGAAPVIAAAARELGILTVGVVTKPFAFEGVHRMKIAEQGIEEMERVVDTLIIIPNQNLFRIANEKTTFADAFTMADDVLYSGVRGVTDLMVMPGLINLDFADIRAIMSEMGQAMMGTGEAEGERRAMDAAEAAIANPLLDDISMKGATGILINITGGADMTLFEVDEAANRIRSEVDPDAHIIFGSSFDENLDGRMRVSIVATGMNCVAGVQPKPAMLKVVPGPQAISVEVESVNTRSPAIGESKPSFGTRADSDKSPAMAGSPTTDTTTIPAVAENEEEAEAGDKASATNSTAQDMPAQPPEVLEEPMPRETAKPAPGTPGKNAADAFIPAPPAEHRQHAHADPFAEAAMVNGSAPASTQASTLESGSEKSKATKGPSLFERVTGTGRATRAAKTKVPVEQSPMMSEAPVESAPTATSAPESHDQGGLGVLDPADRLPETQSEEDLLDIPAFLRRQAS